jgi:hypothetical protein
VAASFVYDRELEAVAFGDLSLAARLRLATREADVEFQAAAGRLGSVL